MGLSCDITEGSDSCPLKVKPFFISFPRAPGREQVINTINANQSLVIPVTDRPGEALTGLRVLVLRVREREVGVGPAGQAGAAP